MRIAFIGGYSVPNWGGIENYVFNLAKHLNRRGWDAVIICRGPKNSNNFIDGVHIIQKKASRISSLSYLLHYIRSSWYVLLSKEKFDIVNYQYFLLAPLYSWLPRLKKIRVFTTIHSFPVDSPKCGRITSFLLHFDWKVSSRFLGRIISVSDTVAALVQDRLGQNSLIVRGGIDIAETNSLDGGYYLYLGRIDPVKGLETLIDAFMMLQPDQSQKLVIIGDASSPYGQSIKERAAADKRIVFPGPIFGDQKRKWLSECKAFVLPSYSEGFPISLLEAMSYGKVCLVSDIGANVEVLTRDLGLWFTPGDSKELFSVINNIENGLVNTEELSKRIRERVETEFTWPIITDNFMKMIINLTQ